MSDPGRVNESRVFTPQWAEDGMRLYQTETSLLNYYGTNDTVRHPTAGFPGICKTIRGQNSTRMMNVTKARYHHPGGMQHRVYRDLYNVLHSSAKPHPGYINTVIEANPGIWGGNPLAAGDV
jgi:hypothetical protein